jgi:hypothetical protein
MHRLTKLLIAAIAFASIQTLNAAAFFQNAVGWSAAVFCWAVVAVVAWRRQFLPQ